MFFIVNCLVTVTSRTVPIHYHQKNKKEKYFEDYHNLSLVSHKAIKQ